MATHILDKRSTTVALRDNMVTSIAGMFPVEGRKNVLTATKVYADPSKSSSDFSAQETARNRGQTWGYGVYGDFELKDKAGKVIDRAKRVRLATIPQITDRFSYIIGGSEYQPDSLWRLKSGVYSRITGKGSLESQVNLAEGQGFKVQFDPNKRSFVLRYGTSSVPALPVMRALGVSERDVRERWGDALVDANRSRDETKDLIKAARIIDKRSTPTTRTEAEAVIRETYKKTRLRKDTTKITLGREYSQVNGGVLLDTTSKLLGINRGTHKVDNRDSLRFKELWAAEDMIPERIDNSKRMINRKLLNNVDRKTSIKSVITPDIFNTPINTFFTRTAISQQPTQVNPMGMLNSRLRTTVLGPGGIASEQAVTLNAKMIDPSHAGFLGPVATPEGKRSGITLYMGLGVEKHGHVPKIKVYDVKKKTKVAMSPAELSGKNVGFPDSYKWKDGLPTPLRKTATVLSSDDGDPRIVPTKDVDYILTSPQAMFSMTTNMVPFLPSNSPGRTEMAVRHLEQAVSLKYREPPLVQVHTGSKTKDESWESVVGRFSAHVSPVAGTVTAVKDRSISIKGEDGKTSVVQMYRNFPLNSTKAYYNSESLVQVGDKVKAKQVIADTNFTRDGVLALGTNMRVAYLPWKGLTFEDGVVISETGSKSLTSSHLFKERAYIDEGSFVDKNKFSAQYPGIISDKNLGKMDETGVVRIGQKVEHGDVLVAALRKSDPSTEQLLLKGLGKGLAKDYRNASLSWEQDTPGVVTNVIRKGKSVMVHVKTDEPAMIGDKIAGRHGNKGVITSVLPDSEMPHTKDGSPVHIIMNPSGVPGRINTGQIHETRLAKVARVTGKTYLVNNFSPEEKNKVVRVDGHYRTVHTTAGPKRVYVGSYEYKRAAEESGGNTLGLPGNLTKVAAKSESKDKTIRVEGHHKVIKTKAGPKRVYIEGYEYVRGYGAIVKSKMSDSNVSLTEELFDPSSGTSLGEVTIGDQYILKQMHQVDKKYSWRSYGPGYDYDASHIPKSGGHGAAQRFGNLGMFSMLSHGSSANIRDAMSYKSDRTQGEVWEAIQTNTLLPAPKVPFAYERFVGYLNGLGVDVEKEGSGITLTPFTDEQILARSSGALTSAGRVLRGKDLSPEKGGLFDEEITGGAGGDKWSHIELAEAIPNPMFEMPIVSLLGLRVKDFQEVMAGTQELDGKTGPAAIVSALKNYDIESSLKEAEEAVKTARESELDRANRKVKYLRMLSKEGLRADEAYTLKNLPVLPPMFRPISMLEGGDLSIDGLNFHYRDVALINNRLIEGGKVLPDELLSAPRADLYAGVGALMATTSGQANRVMSDGKEAPPGILTILGGRTSPKSGFLHKKIFDRRQDLTMRSIIVPDMAIGLDQVRLPRKGAMKLFEPFVVGELTQFGMTPLAARKEIEENTELAQRALEQASSKRPVLFKRDPALHKYSIQAFNVKLGDGKAIGIHPLVVGGFNADFDGDAMSVFLPITKEAVDEAYRMMPSKNIFNPGTGRVEFMPTYEGQLGVFLLTQMGKTKDKSYKTYEDAVKAAKSGDISMTDVITAGGKKTTAGRISFYKALPPSIRDDALLTDPKMVMDKKNLHKIFRQVGMEKPASFAATSDRIKQMGFGYAHNVGFSFKDGDFAPLLNIREKHLAKARKSVDGLPGNLKPGERDKRIVGIYTGATEDMSKEAKKWMAKNGHTLYTMHAAGVKPGWPQLQQLVLAPMLVQNAHGETVPVPVTRSYTEGLDTSGYWVASSGARKGLIQKVQSVSIPGALSKQLLNTTIDTVITTNDCGTSRGIAMGTNDKEVLDRFTVSSIKIGNKTIPKGTIVTPRLLGDLQSGKVSKIAVRSPTKCTSAKGMCAKCYGVVDGGGLLKKGTNIGAIAGQAFGERGTQLSMRTFHTGGVASAAGASSTVDGLDRITQLIKMPKVLPGSASLSPVTGKVTGISVSPAGGWDIKVGGSDAYIPGTRSLSVKKGDYIKKGGALSSGPIDPRQLLELTDIDTVQGYLTDQIHQVYSSEGIKRRNAEVVTRSLTTLAKVDDPGSIPGFIRGDYVSIPHANHLNKGSSNPMKYTTILKGVETLPLDKSSDWMSRLLYRRIKETLKRGAAEGWTSDIHGLHPAPGIAYSAEFGKPAKDTGPY